jgi:uncharacterized protein YbbK (DUF523 family)
LLFYVSLHVCKIIIYKKKHHTSDILLMRLKFLAQLQKNHIIAMSLKSMAPACYSSAYSYSAKGSELEGASPRGLWGAA